MITFLQAIDETEQVPGERDYPSKSDHPPIIGDQVSLGLETRWTVVDIDTYQFNQELLYVAHCAVDLNKVGDRSSWFLIEWGEEREISLQLFFNQQEYLARSMSFEGKSPQVGLVLTGFDVTNGKSYPLPWQVAFVQEYKPISEACYTAIYLAECQAVEIIYKAVAKQEEVAIGG